MTAFEQRMLGIEQETLAQVKALPEIALGKKLIGIYFLVQYDESAENPFEVVYVGMTVRAGSRIDTHRKDKQFNKVFFLEVADASELPSIEKWWIERLRPKYNKTLFVPRLTPRTITSHRSEYQRVTFYLGVDTCDLITALAKHCGVTRTKIIELAVRQVAEKAGIKW